MKQLTFIIALAASLLFASCNKNTIYSDSQDIERMNWDVKDVKIFDADITPEAGKLYDIKLTARFAKNFPVETVPIHVKATMPDGSVQEKNVDVAFKKDGKNMGEGLGDLWDLKAFLIEDLKFDAPGKVKIEIGHAFNNPKVPLMMKIGVEIVQQD